MTTKTKQIRNALSYLRPIMDKMMDNNMDYAEISITFRQKWRDMFNNTELKRMINRYFRFLPLSDIREILLIPEYGDSKNLHYHGIIRGKASELSELKTFLNHRFGRSRIATVRKPEDYKKYMLKEQQGLTDLDEYIYYNYENETS